MNRERKRPLRSPNEDEDMYLNFVLRPKFFAVLAEVVPGIARDLVERVGPAHDRAVTILGEPAGPADPLAWLRSAAPEHSDAVGAVFDALEAWATPYHLHRDDWILEHALHYLRRVRARARTEDEGPLPLAAALTGLGYNAPLPPSSDVVRPPIYQPEHQTPADYFERVGAYMRQVEKFYRASGWEEQPGKQSLEVHLRWLARHQCLGLPYGRCDEGRRPADDSTVRRAVKEMAKLLPLTLAPRPGR